MATGRAPMFRERFPVLTTISLKFSALASTIAFEEDHTRRITMPVTLLSWPPELRNRIYDYVLPSEIQEIRFSFSIFPKVPAILQVSRQLREEANGL